MTHLPPRVQVLGIHFFAGTREQLLDISLEQGGLLVAPAAPALTQLSAEQEYRNALENSEIVITDSGLMVMLWNLFKKPKIPRISGYAYLKELLIRPEIQQKTFWIMPTTEESDRNLQWLVQEKGIHVSPEDVYIAPMYNPSHVEDENLLELIMRKKPRIIINNLGGGTQEKLGYYLKSHLPYKPTIVCTGAALSFFSGGQAPIPSWADRMNLGWLFRCLYSPKKFIPRYFRALLFIPMLLKYGEQSPHQ